MRGGYDQNGDWQYSNVCIYDEYYLEGCSNEDGDFDDAGVWQYEDPCSLDEDELQDLEDDAEDEREEQLEAQQEAEAARNDPSYNKRIANATVTA